MGNAKGDLVDNLIKRTISTIVLLSFVYFLIYVFPNWAFCVVVALFVALGQIEFFRMVTNRNIFVYKYFGVIAGTLIPLVVFFADGSGKMMNFETMLIVVASLFAFTLQFTRKDNARDHLISTALTLFSLFYIGWFFSFFMKIKMLQDGANLVAFLVIVTKATDIGAYLIGSRLGRSELIPRISPKKTKEGTIGGVIVSVVISITLGRYLTGFSFLHLFIMGIILSIVGQVGDLAESLIKRDCNVKDSGSYVAGIGGILDLIDSLLFTAPVFYFYINTLQSGF
jgi:phosphatidate cytidylyltransferase